MGAHTARAGAGRSRSSSALHTSPPLTIHLYTAVPRGTQNTQNEGGHTLPLAAEADMLGDVAAVAESALVPVVAS